VAKGSFTERRTDGVMTRLGRFTMRRRGAVLVASGIFFAGAGIVGAGVASHLSSGGFDVSHSQAVRTEQFLEQRLNGGQVDTILVLTAKGGNVDDPRVAAEGEWLTAQFAKEPGVADAFSYWSLRGVAPLRSNDGAKALIVARLAGNQDQKVHLLDRLTPKYTHANGLLDVRVSGYSEVFREVDHQTQTDLKHAELIIVPLTGILLLFIFRGAVASALPLAVGGLAAVGTMFVLRAIASVTEVSVFALNMTTALSLGLGIDYSLFIVSRYREELGHGLDTEEAVVRAVTTAGRTVVFSAITVAGSLLALLLFPLPFLRSFGYAGIAVVALAGAAAVVTLPAILATIGPRIDKWSLNRRPVPPVGSGFWHRLADAVLCRPIPVATLGVGVLLVLGAPFLHMQLGMPDPRVLPPSAPGRQVVDQFTKDFSGNEGFPEFVLAPNVGNPAARTVDIDAYAARLSAVSGVARVDTATGSYAQGGRILANPRFQARFEKGSSVYFSVVPAASIQPYSPRAGQLISALRAQPTPFSSVSLGGATASFFEAKDALFGRLPVALALIAVATFALLFLAFGSVLVPLKAIVLNLLSLTATFGAMVWVFQQGHLAGLLGFTPRETVDIFNPILMFAIAFGLSMDYEVFMLSRIKEEYDRMGDNNAAVAVGLERTGRLVTAAALLMAAVFLAQVTSEVSIVKTFGLGLALAVLADAFIVRTALVPAFMRIAGRLNWWAPAWMSRVRDRVGFREADTVIVLEEPTSRGPARRRERPLVAAGRVKSGRP